MTFLAWHEICLNAIQISRASVFFSARQELGPAEKQEVVKEASSPSRVLKPSLYARFFSLASLLYAMFFRLLPHLALQPCI